MEAKRKQKTGEREGKKYHTNLHGNPESLSCTPVPETTARMILASDDVGKKGGCLGYESLPPEGRDLWVDNHLFFSSLSMTKNYSKKHQSDRSFSISKSCFRWGIQMPKKKKRPSSTNQDGFWKWIQLTTNSQPALHNTCAVTHSRQEPSRPPVSVYFQ